MKESIVDLLLQLCKASSIQFHIVHIFSWDDTRDLLNQLNLVFNIFSFWGLKKQKTICELTGAKLKIVIFMKWREFKAGGGDAREQAYRSTPVTR